MSVFLLFELIKFDNNLERFADIHGDNMEVEDIKELTKQLSDIVPLKRLGAINSADSIDEAFEYLDLLQSEELGRVKKETPQLRGITQRLAELMSYALYSREFAWDDDWDTLESLIVDLLPNHEVKNWKPLESRRDLGDDSLKFEYVLSIISRRFLTLLWSDLKPQKIDFIDKIKLIQAFRDEYEPNISDSEGFGSDWFMFESFVKASTFGELFEAFANWVNELVFVEYDTNGEQITGETESKDYLYLLGSIVARASTFRGW